MHVLQRKVLLNGHTCPFYSTFPCTQSESLFQNLDREITSRLLTGLMLEVQPFVLWIFSDIISVELVLKLAVLEVSSERN